MGCSRTASVSLLLLLSWAQISLIVPSENGFTPILNVGSPQGFVYGTDFESVTRLDAHALNMGIPNWFEFQGDGGASMWMEGLDRMTPGVTCHSGSRCVGMELTDISKSRRNEFDIPHLENLVGDELFVSVWQYLPADWRLHCTSCADWNWYSNVVPFQTGAPDWQPYLAIQISQPDITKDIFNLNFDYRGITGKLSTLRTLRETSDFPLPRGRWFNVQYYVYRHPTNGVLKVWIDGTLLFDANNISTKDPSTIDWLTTVGKIYYDMHDTFSPYRIWVDDLEIYNTQPAISSFPWESILMGVILGLTTLAAMRRRRKAVPS
jgi:hypothetical protein